MGARNDEQHQPWSFANCIVTAIGVVIFFVVFSSCVMTAFGSPPDPWVRMTSPSRCSGGVFHASREYGIWIATCKHCVRRPGRVRLVFFKNGQRAKVDGQFVRSHRRYDCSVVWVSADHFYELPTATPLADGNIGPYTGQSVYAVGSYAGGTVTPAARHVAISSVDRGAYKFRLNDSAWGGHSGGPVVDAASGQLLGVLWGASLGSSYIISNRALLETFYGIWDTNQAMYSVHDDLTAHQVARKPEIDVKANRADIAQIQREVYQSHHLRDHFEWDWDVDSWRNNPRIEWKIDGRKRYSDAWYGRDGFIWQYQRTGGRYT